MGRLPAWEGLAASKLKSRRQMAGARGQLRTSLSLMLNIQYNKLIPCHCLKVVRQFEAETAAVLLDNVLYMGLEAGSA